MVVPIWKWNSVRSQTLPNRYAECRWLWIGQFDVVIRLCGGVEMLHRNGYVHRDIKPARTVMFDSYNYPVLGDSALSYWSFGKGKPGWPAIWAPPTNTPLHPRTSDSGCVGTGDNLVDIPQRAQPA